MLILTYYWVNIDVVKNGNAEEQNKQSEVNSTMSSMGFYIYMGWLSDYCLRSSEQYFSYIQY